MFCKVCGREVLESTRVCPSCGSDIKKIKDAEIAEKKIAEVPVSREGAEERLAILKPIKICLTILVFCAMFFVVAGFASAPFAELKNSIVTGGESGLSDNEFLLVSATAMGIISGIFSIVMTIFGIIAYFQANKAIESKDEPYSVINKKSTVLLIFVIITGVFSLANVTYLSSAMGMLASYKSVVLTNNVGTNFIFAMVGFLVALGSIVPAIVAFVKSIQFRIRLKKIV